MVWATVRTHRCAADTTLAEQPCDGPGHLAPDEQLPWCVPSSAARERGRIGDVSYRRSDPRVTIEVVRRFRRYQAARCTSAERSITQTDPAISRRGCRPSPGTAG